MRDDRMSGLCCLRDHANAVPPWTCQCECHNRANWPTGGSMDEVTEIFETEREAIAFRDGLELAQNMIDDDHLIWDIEEDGDKWTVTVRFLV